MSKTNTNNTPSCDNSLDELEDLVHGLRDSRDHTEFVEHLHAINRQIDLIKESVQRLCEVTSNCTSTLNDLPS